MNYHDAELKKILLNQYSNIFEDELIDEIIKVGYLKSIKNGELLIVNNILIVGSSIANLGSSSGFSKSERVSPISKSSNIAQ